jgi:hypothetical protein
MSKAMHQIRDLKELLKGNTEKADKGYLTEMMYKYIQMIL